MKEDSPTHLAALSSYLNDRREALLLAWRQAADADPTQTTVSSLTRAQFNDHIPPLLDAFQRKLSAAPGDARAAAADEAKTREDIQHGRQRWQQGYRLEELMREWGHLHRCIAREIHTFVRDHPAISRETLAFVHLELIELINEGVNESAGQYARMQQAEAASRVQDLQQAVDKAAQLERARAELLRQTVHDLRANVQSVSSAADVLREVTMADAERVEFAALIHQGVESVSVMLGDLMDLARLEAGQEKREITRFDAAAAVRGWCSTMRPIADQRKLFLRAEGVPILEVEGDAPKVRRIVQNLVGNALKYTAEGGVIVSWGSEKEHWWIVVKDTGPGILAGPSTPIVTVLKDVTDSARESDEHAAASYGDRATVLAGLPGGTSEPRQRVSAHGEGIGLSIVKRLCELLDASIELASSATEGTTFRVLIPRRYPPAREKS